MSEYPYFFNKEPINFIENFEKTKLTGKIKSRSSYLNRIDNVQLKKEENEYSIKLDESIFQSNRINHNTLGKMIKRCSFISNKYDLIFENFFFSPFSKSIINCIYEKSFLNKSKKYFKFIIPLKEKINFNYQLSPFFYSDEFSSWSRVGCSINHNDENIFVLQKTIKNNNNKEKHYLIIESDKKQNFEGFTEKVFALRVSLGYIIGYFAGERGYYFSYNNSERDKPFSFCFQTQRGEIKNFFQPINRNAYAWLSFKNKNLAKKIYKNIDLRTLTQIEFSNLYKNTLENEFFLGILIQMLESSESSLLLRPGGYSIILESLSSIVADENEEKINPITSKSEAKKFRNELLCVLKKYKDNESFKDIATLEGKINHINQITNREKLILPFKTLGIDLLEEDLKVISSRNDFLHGRIPDYRNLGQNRGIEEKDRDMYYASVRFYTLINMLILKYIGYDSYVLNFSKISEKETTYLVNEDYYRK